MLKLFTILVSMILPFGLNSKSFDVDPISKENTYFNLTDNGDNTYIVSSLKDNVLIYWEALKTGISTIAKSILTTLTSPFETAWSVIQTIIEKIKGLFDGWSFSLPHIDLPHFSISPPGWKLGDLLKGTIPSLGIEWYDKGGIFNSPAVIGVGEKRPEFVGALDDLRKIVREESAPTSIVLNIYGAPGQDVRELANIVRSQLISEVKRKQFAW